VETVHLKEGYLGSHGFYANDIAVIVLANRISMSSAVAPVCVDWANRHNNNIRNGTEGKVGFLLK